MAGLCEAHRPACPRTLTSTARKTCPKKEVTAAEAQRTRQKQATERATNPAKARLVTQKFCRAKQCAIIQDARLPVFQTEHPEFDDMYVFGKYAQGNCTGANIGACSSQRGNARGGGHPSPGPPPGQSLNSVFRYQICTSPTRFYRK